MSKLVKLVPKSAAAAAMTPYTSQMDVPSFRSGEERLILIQHGSYYIGDMQCQPLVDRGGAMLYRRIQKTETYLLRRLTTEHVREWLMNVQAQSLTDSVVSFNAIHCNLVRCETIFLNDRSFILGGLCRKVGLDPDDLPIQSAQYSGYALEEWCASRKFGPNYVKFPTPQTNIRLTTFVGNETEVMEAVGCKVREVYA